MTSAAEYLAQEATQVPRHPFLKPGLNTNNEVEDRKLAGSPLKLILACLQQGVAYHHGGLSFQDRRQVESLFLNGKISVICTTSTLAVGVNLPAHLVIIKGTNQYDFTQSKMVEYSEYFSF